MRQDLEAVEVPVNPQSWYEKRRNRFHQGISLLQLLPLPDSEQSRYYQCQIRNYSYIPAFVRRFHRRLQH